MPAPNGFALTLLAPVALLLGALLQIAIAPLCAARIKGLVATLTCVPALAAVVALTFFVRGGSAVDVNLFAWDGLLKFQLHVDALSVLFAFMGTCIGGLVLLYSIGYMAHDRSATRFYFTMLIFIGGFVALVFSANLFLLYLWWEVIGLCSFSLVGFWYTNREAVAGARKVLLMTHIAGYGLLAAILILYFRTGTAIWTDPAMAGSLTGGIFALMLVALIAKSVQVPLHTWIPEAMAAPTPVSSLLHAACYVTAGVYLAARMHSFRPWPVAWGATLVWIGTVTMVVGVMYAMVQTDLKRMLAFSTVSQIGYMMMGLGIGTPLAIVAGLLHCLNHGFFKGGLFLNAGAVQHAAGTRNMNELGGLAGKMPRTTLWWLIGVANMAGIPLMSGFVSKWMLYAAALQAGWAVPAAVAWLVSLGTVFLCAKATSAVFLGPTTEKTCEAHEPPPSMQWAMGLMAAGSIVLGVAPQLAVNYLLNPILSALSLGAAAQVSWFGLFAGAGSFSTIGGLVLALVSLAVGGAIYMFASLVRPAESIATVGSPVGGAVMAGAGGGIFTGGEPLGDRGRLTAADFSELFAQDWVSFFRWTQVDRVYLGLWQLLLAVARVLARAIAWMEERALVLLLVLSIGVLALFRWLGSTGPAMQVRAAAPVPELLAVACGVAALVLVGAALANAASRRLALLMLLAGGSAVAGLVVAEPWLRLGLLEAAAVLIIPLIWRNARVPSTVWIYATAVALSALSLLTGEFLIESGEANWSRALILASVCIKLAAFPLLFWLLRLADDVPALVLGLIIAVIDMAAFGELYGVAQSMPSLFVPQALWLTIAACTSLVAALLMLAQRSLKRLLVLSTMEDIGFLFLGLASVTALGTSGALFAAATHAVAKALLFACLSGPESAGALQEETGSLASRFPVSAFGFLFGMLAMLGVPPTLGYIGRWRLYEAALHLGAPLLAVFIISSILALIAYVLALTRYWWGPAENAGLPGSEPFPLRAVIVVAVILLLAAGLWPQMFYALLGGPR